MTETKFEELAAINVNDELEERDGLSFLSWAPAWDIFKRKYPDAAYRVIMFDGKPYHYDPNLGYLVMTEVTAGGETLPMWLFAMDSKNKSLLDHSYEYTVKKKDGSTYTKKVDAATMFDINKTLMRCFVKNLAMFGLGLYVYAGEDIPKEEVSEPETKPAKKGKAAVKPVKTFNLRDLISACKDETELETVYKKHKTEIIADPNILKMVADKGKKLRGAA